MQVLFDQIQIAAALNLYYAALFAALTLPDICSAMDTSDGQHAPAYYISWFDRWVGPKYVVMG